jgi:hypothetical protein
MYFVLARVLALGKQTYEGACPSFAPTNAAEKPSAFRLVSKQTFVNM